MTNMVRMKGPDGRVINIPQNNVDKAISRGAQVVDGASDRVRMIGPNGIPALIPRDKMDEAIQRGAKLERREPMGLWQNVKESATDALRQTAQIPRNIIAGMGDVADLPIAAVDYGLKRAGIKKEDSDTFYPGQAAANLIDTATMGYTKPETPREKTFESGTRAIASVPAGAGLGNVLQGVKGVAKLGRGLQKINPTDPTSLAGVGAGALAGHAYNESNPDDLMGTLGTGIAGDIAARSALGLINKKKLTSDLQRYVAGSLKINPKNAEAFNAMGVSPTLGQISDSPLVKISENAIKNLSPTGGLRNAVDKQYEQIRDILGPGAASNAHTSQQAGHKIATDLVGHGNKASDITKKMKKVWQDKIDKSPTRGLIDVSQSLYAYDDLRRSLKSETFQKILDKSPVGKKIAVLRDAAAENHGQAPVEGLDQFRKDLFDLSRNLEPGTNEKRLVDELRNNVTDDIKRQMKEIGALKDWEKYNNFYSRWADLRKDDVTQARELLKSRKTIQHEIFDSLTKGQDLDRELLGSVYASQKKSAQLKTQDSLIQALGTNNRGDFDVHLLAQRVKNQQPETLKLFLSPRTKPQQDKLMAVLKSVDINKDLASYGNPSRTGYMNYALQLGPLLGIAGYRTVTGEPLTGKQNAALVSIVGLMAGSKAFSSPKVVNWMYRGTKIKTPEAMKHHISGIKGILGRPFYQQLKNALREQNENR